MPRRKAKTKGKIANAKKFNYTEVVNDSTWQITRMCSDRGHMKQNP